MMCANDGRFERSPWFFPKWDTNQSIPVGPILASQKNCDAHH
jgi:hypothetical protein